jgi:hypothetical protein
MVDVMQPHIGNEAAFRPTPLMAIRCLGGASIRIARAQPWPACFPANAVCCSGRSPGRHLKSAADGITARGH